jgi:hypothetical protein
MGVAVRDTLSREEACRQLGMSPAAFRRLWREYAPYLGHDKPPRELDHRLLGLMRVAHRLTGEGRPAHEIAAVLTAAVGAAPEVAVAEAPSVIERLDTIAQRLDQSEERRHEDRDRLLMALLRTQQEIGHLRGELAAVTPRRNRRPALRLAFWRRG